MAHIPARRLPCRHYSSKNDGMASATVYPRLLTPPEQSFFLFGMRGVGKSTWARQVLPIAPAHRPAGRRPVPGLSARPGAVRPRTEDGIDARPVGDFVQALATQQI
jgi:hypothetical protein